MQSPNESPNRSPKVNYENVRMGKHGARSVSGPSPGLVGVRKSGSEFQRTVSEQRSDMGGVCFCRDGVELIFLLDILSYATWADVAWAAKA